MSKGKPKLAQVSDTQERWRVARFGPKRSDRELMEAVNFVQQLAKAKDPDPDRFERFCEAGTRETGIRLSKDTVCFLAKYSGGIPERIAASVLTAIEREDSDFIEKLAGAVKKVRELQYRTRTEKAREFIAFHTADMSQGAPSKDILWDFYRHQDPTFDKSNFYKLVDDVQPALPRKLQFGKTPPVVKLTKKRA